MKQPRIAEMVAAELREQILDGRLPDGSVLAKQDSLLEEFGVSPPSLREALRILETEGLITVRRGSAGGSVVHAPDAVDAAYTLALVLESRHVGLEDIAAALLDLEPLCAGLCAARADRGSAVVPGLRDLYELSTSAIDDAAEYTRLGRRFHEALVAGCGNETLILLAGALESLWTAHEREWAREATRRGEFPEANVRESGISAHLRLIDSISEGDVEGTERSVRHHLLQTQRYALGSENPTIRSDLLRDSKGTGSHG